MPQIFQALRCYKCSVFQVHQRKKSNKWQCKLCGEKQSIKRHYGLGTAKDCRLHVQKLNGIRGETDELAEITQNDTNDEFEHNEPTSENPPKKSKWSDYVDDAKNNENKSEEVMYLGNAEVVLEVPKKKRKLRHNLFKVPKKDIGSEDEILQVPRKSNGCAELLISKKNCTPKQECCNRDNYCKTPNDNSTSLEMHINYENSFKVKTDIFPVQNELKIDAHESKAPASLILLNVNRNSRWAQYVDSEENIEEVVFKTNNTIDLNKNPQSLFSLCDDKDLDDVLDI